MIDIYPWSDNTNGAYDPGTGIFTAENNGTYVFSFYAFNERTGNGYGNGKIHINGHAKCKGASSTSSTAEDTKLAGYSTFGLGVLNIFAAMVSCGMNHTIWLKPVRKTWKS